METPPNISVTTDGPRRRRRIAELLHKAMVEVESTLPSSDPEDSIAAEADTPVAMQADLPDSERVVRFLRVTGQSSPANIRNSLGLSRSGTFRVLQALTHARRIVSHGHTRTLVYRLNERAPMPDRIELN